MYSHPAQVPRGLPVCLLACLPACVLVHHLTLPAPAVAAAGGQPELRAVHGMPQGLPTQVSVYAAGLLLLIHLYIATIVPATAPPAACRLGPCCHHLQPHLTATHPAY